MARDATLAGAGWRRQPLSRIVVATIGVAAPILITIARLLQGFSAGGEFGSAVAFPVEHAAA